MDASAFLSVRTFTGFQRDPSLCCQIDPICPTESVPPELNKSGPLNERSQETELKKPVCFIGLSICISGIEGIWTFEFQAASVRKNFSITSAAASSSLAGGWQNHEVISCFQQCSKQLPASDLFSFPDKEASIPDRVSIHPVLPGFSSHCAAGISNKNFFRKNFAFGLPFSKSSVIISKRQVAGRFQSLLIQTSESWFKSIRKK